MDSIPPHPIEKTGLSPATRPSLLARLHQPGGDTRWEQDWREFHDLYQPLLLRFARREGLDEEQAKDVVQEIFVGISKSLPEFNYDPARCRFKTWLYRVAKNKVVGHRRRQRCQLPELLADTGGSAVTRPENLADTFTLEPDAAWNADFEMGLLEAARRHAGRRVNVMNFRLYLYHVVQGHDVDATVAAFRESGVTAAQVHLAKSRVLKLVKEELERLQEKHGE